MNTLLLPTVAALLACAAVGLVSFAVITHREQLSMRRSLALVIKIGRIHPAEAGLEDEFTSSFTRTLVEALGERLVHTKARIRLRRHLGWAGKPTSAALRETIDRKVIYGVVALCLGTLAAMILGGWWWLLPVPLMLAGYFLPDMLVYNKGLARTNEILLELPDALDMLDLCVESGLSLQASLAKVAENQEGAVADEFGRVLHEMQMGVSRADAFTGMAQRTKQEDLQRFVAAMLLVDTLGIPVASVLKEQSRDMRARRFARARESAQKVPVKILAPLMVCFMPGLFIVILGPAAIMVADALKNF